MYGTRPKWFVYSASKASSDMIIRAYNETYGMNTVITNCSNNYGPKQLIPTMLSKEIQSMVMGKISEIGCMYLITVKVIILEKQDKHIISVEEMKEQIFK